MLISYHIMPNILENLKAVGITKAATIGGTAASDYIYWYLKASVVRLFDQLSMLKPL